MKQLFSLVLVIVVFFLTTKCAMAVIFTWDTYTDASASAFIFYESANSLTCDQQTTILNTSSPTYDSGTFPTGFTFFSMATSNETGETIYPEEIIGKFIGGTRLNADFVVTGNADTALLQWEYIPSVTYKVKYKESNDASYTEIDNITTTDLTITGLTNGFYEFNVYAKDVIGRTIETNNVYPTVNAYILNSPPDPPSYKVEAFGTGGIAGWNQTLMVAFDSDDSFIDYYRVDVFSSSAGALGGGDGDILSDIHIPKGSNFCQTIDTSTYPILFFSVSSVDYNGQQGDAYVGYKLIGNIVGTDNEGVAFALSAVDGDDYNILRFYYFQPFTHRSSNYCDESNLYDILPFTYQERMDYNLDGLVDGAEYNFFRAVYGRTGAGY